MSKAHRGDISTEAYWNERVRTSRNRDEMLFVDARRDEFWRRVRRQLDDWAGQGYTVLDLCCGFGKYANTFIPAAYHGVDFSGEMIKLARKEQTMYTFEQADVRNYVPGRQYDVILEINSLHSMGMTPQEFANKFSPYAKVSVATLEADSFIISQSYFKR